MDLSIIRRKLQKKDPAHYTTPEEVVSDVRLMFWNCAKFNYVCWVCFLYFTVTLRLSWLGADVGKRVWEQSPGVCYGLKALSQMWALSMDSEGQGGGGY